MSEKFDAQKWAADILDNCEPTLGELSAYLQDAYAAGQAANGPICHKCGKLVEIGDILCSEHEQQMVLALGAARRYRLQELHDKWIRIFHELSTEYFGNQDAEHIANTYRVCAEELEVIAMLQSTSHAEKSKED